MDRSNVDQPMVTPPPSPLLTRQQQQSNDQCAAAASRSASEAIRQASQSASQQVQQATISASNAIRDAQNSASQSVAQASRSSSSISSSASSAIASLQTSADRAIQSVKSELSRALLRVNLATGPNAATGSSSLDERPRMTGDRTEYDVNGQMVRESGVVVTHSQIAGAIIGSIAAAVMLCALIYWCTRRYRKIQTVARLKTRTSSWRSTSFDRTEHKQVFSGHLAGSVQQDPRSKANQHQSTHRQHPPLDSFGSATPGLNQTPWLTVHKPMSPFGSIRLSQNTRENNLPLGGQLKSPLSSHYPRRQVPRNKSISQTFDPRRQAAVPRDFDGPSEAEQSQKPHDPPTLTLSSPAINVTGAVTQDSRRKGRNVADFIETPTRARYEEARATVWDVDSPRIPKEYLDADAGQSDQYHNSQVVREQESDQRTGEFAASPNPQFNLELSKRRGDRDTGRGAYFLDGEDDVRTPDTATFRSMRFGTAVQGRVLNPSMLGDRRLRG